MSAGQASTAAWSKSPRTIVLAQPRACRPTTSFFNGNTFTPGVLRLTAAFDINPNRSIKIDFGARGGIDTNGFNTTYVGSIGGDATNSFFQKIGAGELRLKGANSYGGTTMVEGGTLVWDYTVNNGSKQATGDVQIRFIGKVCVN